MGGNRQIVSDKSPQQEIKIQAIKVISEGVNADPSTTKSTKKAALKAKKIDV